MKLSGPEADSLGIDWVGIVAVITHWKQLEVYLRLNAPLGARKFQEEYPLMRRVDS